jgi:hypothetical protein
VCVYVHTHTHTHTHTAEPRIRGQYGPRPTAVT